MTGRVVPRLRFSALLLRLRILFGYVPNEDWLRARLSRQVVIDRARAQAAIGELERCLHVRVRGGSCPRLRVPS